VLALADHDNVYMKLSGLDHFADDGPRYESARRFTRRVVDAFGPERLVWGSATPDVVDVHLAHCPPAQRAAVKGETLADLVGGDA